ncbi:uncharacterized protein PFL1_02158 [Pseudozyma flocculosa PF-1]|uniref:Related to dynein light-intermediate chain n=1 Tax=Pseudozyma flocculosa TaxID=84751 RepID=A0A5C3FAB1_9BASI|nr:uncharacterized protein PFL1_02158 [Pseudozyma flocculosa PF-1]EPQ30041.1 hypothetical protein PFL1_02158 [Pseudozyma flocculosa PF-1]SPO41374.1 related to dynein light-intermediate chain [Pseudozyma flocculosa]
MDGLGIQAAQPNALANGATTTSFDTPTPSAAAVPHRQHDEPAQQHSNSASAPAPNGTAESEQNQDLWSSILNSVKSKKAIVTKNVILLGEPQTGKSTLLSSLASASPSGLISSSAAGASAARTPLVGSGDDKDAAATVAATSRDKLSERSAGDLGLGYSYFEVADEKDKDEVVARVGVHTLPSSDPAYTSLLPFALPAPIGLTTAEQASSSMAALAAAVSAGVTAGSGRVNGLFQPHASIDALQDSLVLITLDWEQPWTFLDQLRNWLEVLRELVDSASGGSLSKRSHEVQKWSRTQVALDEMRERLEAYLRHYVEPQPSGDASTTNGIEGIGTTTILPPPSSMLSAALQDDEVLPLTDGMLTENWGVPIVVTCTKADLIAKLEREKDFKEEQFDYIQQVLRTVCMKYGAALFFTSHTRPQSFDILRSYILHRLFTPHLAAPGAAAQANGAAATDGKAGTSAAGAATIGAAGGSTEFKFPYRAITTDRDTLLVPSGWDSWGKIRALRDGFDCKGMARGWEYDCEFERLRRARRLPKGDKDAEDQLDKEIERDAEDRVRSAVKLYEDIVADYEAGPPPHILASRVKQPDEQDFLGQHYATLQKDPDPRFKFAKQNAQLAAATSAADGARGNGAEATSPAAEQDGPGMHMGVGPMAGSGLSLPGIDRLLSERAASMEDGFSSSSTGANASSSSASSRPARVAGPSRRDTASGRDGISSSSASARKDAASLLAGISTGGGGSAADIGSPTGGGAGLGGRSSSSRPTSPALAGGSASPSLGDINDPNNPKQSEVLHTFFQSLLKEKGPSGSSMRMLGRDLRPSRSQRSGGSGTGGQGTPAKERGGGSSERG